jgi:hypothetical protein
MPPTKPFSCVECGETDPSRFNKNRKSLCKTHSELLKTPELRKKIIKPYCCIICGDNDESHFHVYRKTKCKKHYNTRIPPINLETNSESEDEGKDRNNREEFTNQNKSQFKTKRDILTETSNQVKIKIIRRKVISE